MAHFPKLKFIDLVIILACCGYAFLFQMGRFQAFDTIPFIYSDTGHITTFAAARDHEAHFTRDGILGDPRNYHFYLTVQVVITQLLGESWGGYGFVPLLLVGLHVFFQLAGFYLLGLSFFKSRYWAILLMLASAFWGVPSFLEDSWGLFTDMIPRFTFSALLPYIWLAVVAWQNQPSRWQWIMVAAGLLIYIHPVSAPPIGFATWCGFLVLLPAEWSLRRKMNYLLWLGIIYVVAILPFAFNYLRNTDFGAEKENYDYVIFIMRSIYAKGYLDMPYILPEIARLYLSGGLLVPACLGIYVSVSYFPRARREVGLICAWMLGLVLTSGVLPYLEQELAHLHRRVPYQIDLVRGLRFLAPLMMILIFLPLAGWYRKKRAFRQAILPAVLGIWLTVWGMASHWSSARAMNYLLPTLDYPRDALACFPHLEGCKMTTYDHARTSLLEAIATHTPPEALLFVVSDSSTTGLAMRYHALRSVVYLPKDGAAKGYGNHTQLIAWWELHQRINGILGENSDPLWRLEVFALLASEYDADYLIMEHPYTDLDTASLGLKLTFANEFFSLIDLRNFETSPLIISQPLPFGIPEDAIIFDPSTGALSLRPYAQHQVEAAHASTAPEAEQLTIILAHTAYQKDLPLTVEGRGAIFYWRNTKQAHFLRQAGVDYLLINQSWLRWLTEADYATLTDPQHYALIQQWVVGNEAYFLYQVLD